MSTEIKPNIGRALPVALTEAGRSLLDQADGIVLDVDDRMTADLAPDDVRRLASLLTTCVRNLRSCR
ncbi:hypothetical protein [Saccharopolyspora rosea]|uniref:Uncharacterized protein n=1 Tax=Saccharopolyspora rosea TaxID=524884 RepID=A0ABW3FTG8_9PSEU|nr:hypothetical protein [Saccharopolyspora rosea]